MRPLFARAARCSLLALCVLAFPQPVVTPARAAEPVVWDLANEYPASAIPGQADSFFAAEVARETAGALVIRPVPDAKSGLRSRD